MISEMNLQDLENIKDCLLTDFDNFWSYNILKQELENGKSKYFVAKQEKNTTIQAKCSPLYFQMKVVCSARL